VATPCSRVSNGGHCGRRSFKFVLSMNRRKWVCDRVKGKPRYVVPLKDTGRHDYGMIQCTVIHCHNDTARQKVNDVWRSTAIAKERDLPKGKQESIDLGLLSTGIRVREMKAL
jgi:hypothetical protein